MSKINKFLEECRALRLKGVTEEQWEYAEKLGQACIYIDQLQAEEPTDICPICGDEKPVSDLHWNCGK